MTLNRRVRVAITSESSGGEPVWGPNTIYTDMPIDGSDVAVENLLAGTRYWVKTWTEDTYGNKSPELLRVVDTPPDPYPPAVPTGLSLTSGAYGFRARWTDVSDTDLAFYEVAYCADDGSMTEPLLTAAWSTLNTKTNYLWVEQTVGQLTWVKVRAFDFSGNASEYTDSASITPFRHVPLLFGGPGVFDEDSPCATFFKVPSTITSISECIVSLAFREFFAQARDAASSGTLTSASGGGSTSGSSSASTSDDEGNHQHIWGAYVDDTAPGGTTSREYVDGSFTPKSFALSTNLSGDLYSLEGEAHAHGMAHTHSTPNHQHTVSGHTHDLTYGTYEETYPVSHSATLRTYKRVAGAWVLQDTVTGLTADLEDVDLTDVVVGPGDWKLTVQSAAGQPQGGRLGVDIFGSITAVFGGPDILGATVEPGATYVAGSLWVGGVEVFDETGALLVGAAPTGAAGGDLSGTYPNPTVVNNGHTHNSTSVTTHSTAHAHSDLSGVGADDHHNRSHDHSAAGDSTTLTPDNVRITSVTDAALASTGHGFQVGDSAGANIIADTNEIMARNAGAAADLLLNNDGGRVRVNSASTPTTNAEGITFGSDVDLFRSAANVLKTDDSLIVGVDLTVGADATVTGTATVGTLVIGAATVTTAGKNLIDDATTGDQRTTLGLGSFATISSLAHSSTTGITADDHHNQSHTHASAGDSTTLAPVTLSPSGTTTIGEAFIEGAVITPAQIVANTNSYLPTGGNTAVRWRLSTDASRDITGISSSVTQTDGRLLILMNVGGFNIVLKHDVTSTAANRFYCPNSADVTLRPNGWVMCIYDTTSSRWRVMGA